MTRWLVIVALSSLLAAPVRAAPASETTAYRPLGHPFDLRLVKQSPTDQDGSPHWGIAPDTRVSPNSTIGATLIDADPSTPDGRLYGHVPRAQAPAVRFRLKF